MEIIFSLNLVYINPMRITGGIYINRKILCPKGIIRPSMDRMRESLFAILGDISGFSFLDLFSGSGIIGIEAASRGASPIVLVEKDFKKKSALIKNISFVDSVITPVFKPVELFLNTWKFQFDIIFLDPPFAYNRKEDLIQQIGKKDALQQGGHIIIHHPSSEILSEEISKFKLADKRIYGGSTLSFFR